MSSIGTGDALARASPSSAMPTGDRRMTYWCIYPSWSRRPVSGWHCTPVCGSRKRITANCGVQWPLRHGLRCWTRTRWSSSNRARPWCTPAVHRAVPPWVILYTGRTPCCTSVGHTCCTPAVRSLVTGQSVQFGLSPAKPAVIPVWTQPIPSVVHPPYTVPHCTVRYSLVRYGQDFPKPWVIPT